MVKSKASADLFSLPLYRHSATEYECGSTKITLAQGNHFTHNCFNDWGKCEAGRLSRHCYIDDHRAGSITGPTSMFRRIINGERGIWNA